MIGPHDHQRVNLQVVTKEGDQPVPVTQNHLFRGISNRGINLKEVIVLPKAEAMTANLMLQSANRIPVARKGMTARKEATAVNRPAKRRATVRVKAHLMAAVLPETTVRKDHTVVVLKVMIVRKDRMATGRKAMIALKGLTVTVRKAMTVQKDHTATGRKVMIALKGLTVTVRKAMTAQKGLMVTVRKAMTVQKGLMVTVRKVMTVRKGLMATVRKVMTVRKGHTVTGRKVMTARKDLMATALKVVTFRKEIQATDLSNRVLMMDATVRLSANQKIHPITSPNRSAVRKSA